MLCARINKHYDFKKDFLVFFQKERRCIKKQLVQSLGKKIESYQMNAFSPRVYELV